MTTRRRRRCSTSDEGWLTGTMRSEQQPMGGPDGRQASRKAGRQAGGVLLYDEAGEEPCCQSSLDWGGGCAASGPVGGGCKYMGEVMTMTMTAVCDDGARGREGGLCMEERGTAAAAHGERPAAFGPACVA